jgi:prepilin-type N-terminal cleavage/methylation domain-containing protein
MEDSRRGRRLEHARARVLPGSGFTLVELLVVITIMGMIAAMVVGMSALAARKKHDTVVAAMKSRLMVFIDTYHSKMGFYPPDNAMNAALVVGSPTYEQSTAMNSLIYELTGASNIIGTSSFRAFDGTLISALAVSNFCQRGGIANSLPDETRVFYQPLPNPSDYVTNSLGLKQLIVPVPLTGTPVNFWHYDCSNPNRHNPLTYDLWAEYSAGTDKSGNPITSTNCNW